MACLDARHDPTATKRKQWDQHHTKGFPRHLLCHVLPGRAGTAWPVRCLYPLPYVPLVWPVPKTGCGSLLFQPLVRQPDTLLLSGHASRYPSRRGTETLLSLEESQTRPIVLWHSGFGPSGWDLLRDIPALLPQIVQDAR